MKTRITLLIASVALVTLSFTFASVQEPSVKQMPNKTASIDSEPVGGLFAEDAVN